MSGALEQPLSPVNTDDPVLSWPSTPHLPLPFPQVPEQLPSLGKDTVESKLLSVVPQREKDGGELRASRRRVCRAESEKRDLNVFEQSPGLISDTNRATGKLCRAEGGESEGGEGERQMDRHAEEERDRQLTGLLRRNLVDRCL